MHPISLSEIIDNPDHYCIIDIRENYEFEFGNIGSKHIPMAEVMDRFQELPKEKMLVFMCKSGARASALSNLLATEKGLKNQRYLEGGIEEWKEKMQLDIQIA
jgi:sulfur-carrier protein adenylyltransferase/sulfurtransferase